MKEIDKNTKDVISSVKKFKKNGFMEKYKSAIEKMQVAFEDFDDWFQKEKENDLSQFTLLIKLNKLDMKLDDVTSFFNKLVINHSIDNEDDAFSEYYKNYLDKTSSAYPILTEYKESYVESLFKIVEFRPDTAETVLEDVLKEGTYVITDISLSVSSNKLLNY